MSKHTAAPADLDGTGRTVGLVCSRFNESIVARLAQGARDALAECGVSDEAIHTIWVPGAWEIPMAVKRLADSGRYDALVGIGAVVRGETYHFEVIADQSAAGLMQVALDTGVVVANGIITVESMEQAEDRAGGSAGNKGAEAALAALETLAAVERA